MNYKKSFSLLEVIIVIFISSVVLVYTFIFTKELYFSSKTNQELSILKIDLNSTKIILEKNKDSLKDKISYKDGVLYFENGILLKDVNSFTLNENSQFYTIKLKIQNKISKTWIIKK